MLKKILTLITVIIFVAVNVLPAGAQAVLLPEPAQMIGLSPAYKPCVLRGIKLDSKDPFRFDFVVDQGDSGLQGESLKEEARHLVKYFLASLTTPEKDLWVNLSPYENNRIVDDDFGRTEMGRDLLAVDYILKQITSSLMYPDSALGKKFWGEVYRRAYEKFGTTDIPVDTFNKVWIVPEKAVIHENSAEVGKNLAAYIEEARLKVMLETDYLATSHATPSNEPIPTRGHLTLPEDSIEQGKVSPSRVPTSQPMNTKAPQGDPLTPNGQGDIAKAVIREVIIPVLEQEVNEGKNFASLRQVYHSLLLAVWLKKKLRTATVVQAPDGKMKGNILSMVFLDRKKTGGIETEDPRGEIDGIYGRYVEAFKKGVYNLIREDYDMYSQETLPRKYFSGGVVFSGVEDAAQTIVGLRDMPIAWKTTATVVAMHLMTVFAQGAATAKPSPKPTKEKPGTTSVSSGFVSEMTSVAMGRVSANVAGVETKRRQLAGKSGVAGALPIQSMLTKMGLTASQYESILKEGYQSVQSMFTYDEYVSLVTALIYVESSYNPSAKNPRTDGGFDRGLTGISPNAWKNKINALIKIETEQKTLGWEKRVQGLKSWLDFDVKATDPKAHLYIGLKIFADVLKSSRGIVNQMKADYGPFAMKYIGFDSDRKAVAAVLRTQWNAGSANTVEFYFSVLVAEKFGAVRTKNTSMSVAIFLEASGIGLDEDIRSPFKGTDKALEERNSLRREMFDVFKYLRAGRINEQRAVEMLNGIQKKIGKLVDPAQGNENQADPSEVGGIDLNPARLDMQFSGDGGVDGLQYEFTPDQIKDFDQNVPGLVPVVINVKSISNVPEFLGFK